MVEIWPFCSGILGLKIVVVVIINIGDGLELV
jgi:hypothetical protein